MIVTYASGVHQTDLTRFAWTGLKRFHHVPSLTEALMKIHSIPEKHRPNAAKQANQIRQCLIQAKEYRDAASVTSLATRPLLLYYSCMCLALAQILFKGSGSDSLDKARGEHAHHGLLFSVSDVPKTSYKLAESAASLKAEPMINKDNRRGTFELWHRTAREAPLAGRVETQDPSGAAVVAEVETIFHATDERIGYLPSNGITFLECIKCTPGMLNWLHDTDVDSDIARAAISLTKTYDGRNIYTVSIHPGPAVLVDKIREIFRFRPEDYDKIQAYDHQSGFSFTYTSSPGDRPYLALPYGMTWNSKEVRFFPIDRTMNEFGYLYCGLYMLGNYARYFPDKWISDVDAGSILSLAADEFISIAEQRISLLTLSELSLNYYVPLA